MYLNELIRIGLHSNFIPLFLAVGCWLLGRFALAFGGLVWKADFFLLTANSQQPTANSLKEAQIPNE
jgi:hypothetical protein